MIMRRLVAALCCSLLAIQPQHVIAAKLKGATRRSLQVTVTRPPVEDEPKDSQAKGTNTTPKNTATPKTPNPAAGKESAAPKAQHVPVAYDHYTWSSGDHQLPKSAHAVVSKSLHDEYEDKMKGSKMSEADDHYPEPKSTSKDNHYNRPPHPAGASPDVKSSGGGDKGGGSKGGGGGSGANKSQKSGSKSGGNNKGGGSYKSSGNKASGGYKSSGGGSKGGGASYDGGSYDDMPVYKPPADKQSPSKDYSTKGSKQSSKGGDTKSKSKSSSKDDLPRPPGTTPRPPKPGEVRPQGDPLTGVPVTRFAIQYNLADTSRMPMTDEYEDVHEHTYLWLYTILFQTYGDRMRNLLTDDTSNIFQQGQPITIEYASVILFDSTDPDIPTTADLDVIVQTAFTGANMDAYVDGLQGLPDKNPFSTTTSARLVNIPPGQGRTVIGSLATRVSTPGMLPTMMSLAGVFVLLAGGAAVYKSKNAEKERTLDKGFDTFPQDEPTVMDDYTVAMSNISEKSGRSRQTWDLALEVEPQENLSPITEHTMDPDLAGWSDYFDSSNGSKESDRSSSQEEHSHYSIEDFVNEAERSLLGVRIRYPGESTTGSPTDCETGGKNETETSTAIVPAPSSAIVTAPPSSLMPVAPSSIIPHGS